MLVLILRLGSGVGFTVPRSPVPYGLGVCAGGFEVLVLVLEGTLKIVVLSMMVFNPTMIGPLDELELVDEVVLTGGLGEGVGCTVGACESPVPALPVPGLFGLKE